MLLNEKHKSQTDFSSGEPLRLRSIEDRMHYYKDFHSRLLLKIMLENDGKLLPRYDSKTGGFVYGSLNVEPELIKRKAEKMVEGNLLNTLSLNSATVCPYHGETAFHVLLKCKKHHAPLERKELWEHLRCGYISSSDTFKNIEGNIVCPRCNKAVKPAELKRLGVWFSCRKGHENVSDPDIILHCITGNHEVSLLETQLIERAEYQLNPLFLDEIKFILSFYDTAIEALSSRGYTIERPFLKGDSGVEHMFDLVAKSENKSIFILEVFFSENEVPDPAIISFLTKIYDTRPEKAVLVIVPSITDTAMNMLKGLGINVLVSPTIHEAKGLLSTLNEA